MIRKIIIVVLTLAAVATVGIWLLVPPAPDGFLRDPARTPRLRLTTRHGGFILSYGVFLHDKPLGIGDIYGSSWTRFGFVLERYESLPNPPIFIDGWALQVPFWCPVILFLAYPTLAFLRGPVRRYRRRKRGLCVRCGYNLTGNVSGVCPECGTKIEKP